jgi:hypothetical protein
MREVVVSGTYGPRPGSKAARTREVVHRLLLDHHAAGELPTSGRFVFYELEQRGDATKPDPTDGRPNKRRSKGWPPGAQDVTDALTWLREEGVIPWSWVVDESRTVACWQQAESVAQFLLDTLPVARINPWQGPPPLILCESRATAGVLRATAQTYVAPVSGTAGQAAGFLRTEVAPLLEDEPRVVLYLGDLDRSGTDIENNTRRVLEDAAPCRFGDGRWRRLGMTEALAHAHGITPIWKVDGRDKRGREAIEVESLGQAGVVALVRDALDELLPEPLDRVLERERRQRRAVAEALNRDGQP